MKRLLVLLLLATGATAQTLPLPARPLVGPIHLAATAAYPVSAIAPLSVFFDLTNTTSSFTPTNGSGVPFLDLDCRWDFGDADVPWAYGAHVGAGTFLESKNRAQGLVAVHVYETPGPKTPSVSCTDGTNSVSYTFNPIVVRDPNTAAEFAGTNTKCFAANTLPVAGVDGCPVGAATHNLTVDYGTADFDAAINAHAGSNRRLLFKHDDTFLLGSSSIVQGVTGIIGMYGTGAKPDIQLDGVMINTSANGIVLGSGTFSAADWRISDLRIGGSGVPTTTPIFGSGGTSKDMLILRNDLHDLGYGINTTSTIQDALTDVVTYNTLGAVAAGAEVLSLTSVVGIASSMGLSIKATSGGNSNGSTGIVNFDGYYVREVNPANNTITVFPPIAVAGPNGIGTTMSVSVWTLPFNPSLPMWDRLSFVDNKVERILSGIGVYMTGTRLAIMGNFVNDSDHSGSEFIMRIPTMTKGVINNNTLSNAKFNKSLLTLRAPQYIGSPAVPKKTYTEYAMVTGNKFQVGTDTSAVTVMPKGPDTEERHRYVRFSDNLFISGANTGSLLSIDASDTDLIENNVFDMSNAVGGTAFSFSQASASINPAPRNSRIFNNTFVKRNASPTCDGVAVKCGGFVGIFVGLGSTNMLVANNLVYAPLAFSNPPGWFPLTSVRDQTSGGVTGAQGTYGNSSDAQMINTNPNFLNGSGLWNAISDYKPNCTGTTYPCGAGVQVPIVKDARGVARTSLDIGAVSHD